MHIHIICREGSAPPRHRCRSGGVGTGRHPQATACCLREISPHLDGIVYHPIKSCRTVSTGLADRRSHVAEEQGVATLFLESDMMDKRVVSEAQMRNRVDAFFEGLISRKQQAVA